MKFVNSNPLHRPRILFADDDRELQKIFRIILEREGMEFYFAYDGDQALQIWRKQPLDLVLLDVRMPGKDGLEVCRTIRQSSELPVIMLTALGKEEQVVEGLEAGADDYIVKPLRKKELLARIKVILKRGMKNDQLPPGSIEYGQIVLDLVERHAKLAGVMVSLSDLEFRLLQYFMKNIGHVVSKKDLLQQVWEYSKFDAHERFDYNLIEAAIRRLRKKLEDSPSQPHYIQTVWGMGYRFGSQESLPKTKTGHG